MILALASGSRGHYRVDDTGRVYVPRSYVPGPADGSAVGLSGFRDGDRPHAAARQFDSGTTYWLPLSYSDDVTDDQRDEIEEARRDRDRLVALAWEDDDPRENGGT